ncbi:MAG: hypothetical protein EOP07_15285, partial [Proteobacteria bacterium]
MPNHSPSARMTLEHFWQDTSLGSPKEWPSCLKVTLSNMFASAEAQCLVWGDEQYFFYNDSFAFQFSDVLSALPYCGTPIKQWPELWNEVARDVMRTVCEKISFRAGDRLLVTGGEGHDTHHFYSYSVSPIFDVHGFVRGCLLNFTSLNSHRMRERRLNTLFELARETSYSSSPIEVLSAAMSVLRKNSEDFRFTLFLTPLEKGQWYLREWTGFTTPPHQ